eukprot:CAMPEP_0169400510 /NCGR_PEP_ID=MMETSP1017-20121227/53887_1 /TAXON_ID=342587 /ORGANISM="Karlodinium micrum, Strain CCMP2283" /LENGTH=44 /DNA_ID= /DNA_START= /DNA_END= /DNA_ORIENTATION=
MAGSGMAFHIGNVRLPQMHPTGGTGVQPQAARGHGVRGRGRSLP